MAASPVFITSTTLHCALPLEIEPSTRPIATSPDFAQRSLKSGPVLAARFWKSSSAPGQASGQQAGPRRIRPERSSPAT